MAVLLYYTGVKVMWEVHRIKGKTGGVPFTFSLVFLLILLCLNHYRIKGISCKNLFSNSNCAT